MQSDMFGGLGGLAGIVTGAGRGIGAGCASTLAGLGARILAADIDAGRLASLSDSVTGAGGEIATHVTDVRDWSSVQSLATACLDTYGAIDFVVANAGIGSYSKIDTGEPDAWKRVVETNLLGVLYTVRATYPHMKERGRGHIVLMASIAGRQTWVGEPVYIATKWGVVGFGWALRKEAIPFNVRVTMLEPGMVDTPLVRETEEGRDELERFAALSIDDVARSVAFALAQPDGVAISELMITPVGPEL